MVNFWTYYLIKIVQKKGRDSEELGVKNYEKKKTKDVIIYNRRDIM